MSKKLKKLTDERKALMTELKKTIHGDNNENVEAPSAKISKSEKVLTALLPARLAT